MIYYVEDDANIRELVIYTLNQTGLSAKGFPDAAAFFTASAEEKPSLVLLDIVMPDMDGFEVLARMAGQDLLNDIPVIMVSSEDSPTVIHRAYELGASDFIRRPFDARIVHRRVSNLTKLYARQRRLSRMVAQQFHERQKQLDGHGPQLFAQGQGFAGGELHD